MESRIEKVQKRDGSIVDFDRSRIEEAIFKALTASGEGDGKRAKRISDKVVKILNRRFKKDEIPHVEQIQDIVEEVLILEGLAKTAKAYILYREQRRRIREAIKVSEEAIDRLDQYLGRLDWEVQENANMAFSLQGLNHYGVSYIIKKYWLNKIYPKEIREAYDSGDFHIHNLDTLACYTFFGREVVVAKLNDELKLISLKDLYQEISQPEILLNEKDDAWAKYPENLYVLDKNGWVKVLRMVRKKKDREMRFIKSEQGQSVIVTDNHPFIVQRKGKEMEIEAEKVREKEDLIFSVHIPSLLKSEKLFSKKYLYLAEEFLKKGYQDFFLEGFEWQDFIQNWGDSLKVEGTLSTSNSANSLDNKLELSEDLGYLVGLFIAEGNYHGWRLVISNSNEEIIKRIQRICSKLGVRSYLNKNKERTPQISINSSTLKLVFEKIFQLKKESKNKILPPDILNYNLDFIRGVIAGMIDGDGTKGTINKDGGFTQLVTRISARTALEQISILLQFFGIIGRSGASCEDIGKKNIFRGKEIIQNYPLYRLTFSKKENVDFPSFKYQKAKPARKHWRSEKYDWNKVLNNEWTKIPDKVIYDITTESGTFLCNGLLVHNCMGWDLYDLLLKGFGGVPGKVESAPAKHFRTALGQVVNFLYTLQGECYSEDTQVLTENGWKYFYEVKPGERVFTLNPQTNEIQPQTPYRFYVYDYSGELYHFKSKKFDLLVTPGHRMLVDQYAPHLPQRYKRKFVEAKDFNPNEHFIPKGGTWKGDFETIPQAILIQKREPVLVGGETSLIKFSLPEIQIQQYLGFKNEYKTIRIGKKDIEIDDWLKFFGFWIAEGCTTLRIRKRKRRKKVYFEYQVRITQNKGKIADEFEEVLKKLPFNYQKRIRDKRIEFRILNKQLFSYLRRFGKREEKFIPKEIKNLPPEKLKILFDWMMKGDGYVGDGNVEYSTKSKKLADDVQEIALKLGYSANIYQRKKGNFIWHDVGISKAKHFRFRSREKNIKKIKYKGKVYCLEVPNHTLYVRRNGKATWCGNCAGAVALSNFDTLLAPFIRYDNLNYQQVKQSLQEFLFNMAIPTRVGFQCVSEDTQILTPEGWKGYDEVEGGDVIKTFNLKTREIEDKKVDFVFKRKYKGVMYQLKNRIQDQLISPQHQVVRRKFNTQNYTLQPIEEILKLRSPIIVPIAGKNSKPDANVSDEQIKLMAWIISEGNVEKPGKNYRSCYRVSIYQSKIKNKKHYDEIVNLLNHFNFRYSNHPHLGLGEEVEQLRINAEDSRKIHQWFGTKENVHFIPEWLLNLSQRQSRLFLETYLKGDGKEGCKITTSNLSLLDDLQRIIINAGYGFTLRKQKPTNPKISQGDVYILRIIRHPETYITKIKKVNYEGIIWCPHTENGTIIARRKGKVFITGNCPFSNITLDLKPSPVFAKQPVILDGKPQDKTYGEFEEEMKIFDKALYEVYMEGDKSGRPFHFPIPTINITKDFPWEEPAFDGIFEASAKYGTNYFANYINSEMKPDDVRSMCLDAKEEILIRNSKKIKRLSIKKVVENYKARDFDQEGWADCKKEGNLEVLSLNPKTLRLEWVPVKRFLKIEDDNGIEITTEDGKNTTFSSKHPIPVYTPEGVKMKFAKEIKKGDYLLTLKKANDEILSKKYQKIEDLVLDEDLAKILGYFVADGNYLFENRKGYTHFGEPRGIQFSFKTGDYENLNLIRKLIKKVFKLKKWSEKQDPRYNTYYLYIYNTELARKLYNAGFRKYGRLPEILFNSPASVIKSFLEFYLRGDGYEKRKEIHLNDLELSRDLALLFSLIGQPITYKLRKRSQRIYLQHSKSKIKRGNGRINNPILAERIPGWMVLSTRVPGLIKSRMVGFDTLEKYNAHTPDSLKIKSSDIYLVRVKKTRIKKYKKLKEFYDLELEKNHLFVHSLGQISFNCCRLRLNLTELYNRGGGGLFGSGSLTGSIGVVTINLPRIGYLSKTKKEFFERLAKVMDLAKESLEIKRKAIENYMEKGLYPYSRHYLQGVKKMRGKYFANHFSTIGLVGMNEALLNFLGENIASRKGRKFALEVMDFMRERLVKYQRETGNLYNLEATPAESTAYRLALKDKEKYPEITAAGTKKVPYYTNSSQLPVNYTDDIFEALKLQDELQCKYTGGCIEKGNRVLTDKGLIKIENIVKNFEKLKPIKALSYNKEKGISEWDEIVEAVAIDVKKHNKIRIIGERNLDITTSDWHPFFILERFKPNPACPICETEVRNLKAFAAHIRWNPECKEKYNIFPKYQIVEKRADELKVGDYILQNSYNLYPERISELNNELMWLIGFFIGDGSISEFIDNRGGNKLLRYRVRFHSRSREALKKVVGILNKYFGCNVKVIKNDKRSYSLREVSTSKKEVSNFFFKYGFWSGKKVYNIYVPQKVKENLTKENVYSFLSGLMDSDGALGKRNGDFEYQTVSPKLADDLLEILTRAGLMVSKSLKKTKREKEIDIWRLRIPQYELTRIKKKLTIVVNPGRIKDELSNRKKRYMPVIRVKKVSKIDVKDNQFYDLMTRKNHNYLAGKDCLVFVHNTVLHLFLGERVSDTQTVKNLIKKIFENFKLPYITFTPTFSICPVHGYLSGEHFLCPKCTIKQPCEVYSRIVGYYRPVSQYNIGKQQEFKQRKMFKIPKL